MAWPLRLVEMKYLEDDGARYVVNAETGEPMKVGDCWYQPEMLERFPHTLADEYFRDNAHRPPLMVKLPGGHHFCVDWATTKPGGRAHGSGWTVTGEPPAVTLSPSVNLVGNYHGWIQGGVISDDVEGRTFDAEGKAVRHAD